MDVRRANEGIWDLKSVAIPLDEAFLRHLAYLQPHGDPYKDRVYNLADLADEGHGFYIMKPHQTSIAPDVKLGRFYGNRIMELPRHLKHTMFHQGGIIDLDFSRSYPTICAAVARSMPGGRVNADLFDYYVSSREKIVAEAIAHFGVPEGAKGVDEDDVKNLLSRILFGGGVNSWLIKMEKEGKRTVNRAMTKFMEDLKAQAAALTREVTERNPELADMIRAKKIKEKKDEGEREVRNGTFSYYVQQIEQTCLFVGMSKLRDLGVIKHMDGNVEIPIVSLEHDGINIPRPNMSEEELKDAIKQANAYILEKCKIPLRFETKPHNSVDYDAIESFKTGKVYRKVAGIYNSDDDDSEGEKETPTTLRSILAKIFCLSALP